MLNNTRLEKFMSNGISFEVYDSCFPNPMRTMAENKTESTTRYRTCKKFVRSWLLSRRFTIT